MKKLIVLTIASLIVMSDGFIEDDIRMHTLTEVENYNSLFEKNPLIEKFYMQGKQKFESSVACYEAFQQRQEKIKQELVIFSVQHELQIKKNGWDQDYFEIEERRIKDQIILASSEKGNHIENDRDIYYYLDVVHRYKIETDFLEAKRHEKSFNQTLKQLYKELRLE